MYLNFLFKFSLKWNKNKSSNKFNALLLTQFFSDNKICKIQLANPYYAYFDCQIGKRFENSPDLWSRRCDVEWNLINIAWTTWDIERMAFKLQGRAIFYKISSWLFAFCSSIGLINAVLYCTEGHSKFRFLKSSTAFFWDKKDYPMGNKAQ